MFRFSDPAACAAALRAAGFVEPVVTEIPLFYCPPTAEQVLEFTYRIAVRMQMILALQTRWIQRRSGFLGERAVGRFSCWRPNSSCRASSESGRPRAGRQ
jgi:hypothetical protein